MSKSSVPPPVPPIGASLLPTSTPQISLPSEPLPSISVLQGSTSAPGAPAPVVANAPSASVQVIQVMTSQGLKTFRLTSNKSTPGAEPPKAEGQSDQILKIQQPLPIQIPATTSSLLRAKLPTEVVKSFPVQPTLPQQPHPQQVTRLITMGQTETVPNVIKVSSKSCC